MKRLLQILAFLMIVSNLQAQLNLERVITTTGGTFFGEGNMVKLYSFETGEQETNVIGEWLGDFSNDVVVDGRFAYAHIGRAFGSTLGEDIIYKVDLITYDVVDSLPNIPGAFKLFVYEDLLMVAKKFGGTGANVEFYDKNDLSQPIIFSGTEVTAGISDHTLMDDKLYLCYTESDTGRVAVYNMTGDLPAFEEIITLDTLSKGMNGMINDGTNIYATSNHEEYNENFEIIYAFAGVSRINPADGSFATNDINGASNPLVIAPSPIGVGSIILGNFAGDGNFVDANTLNPLGFGFLPDYVAGIADGANQYLWIQETDYSSFGKVTAYNTMGEIIIEFDTDISGNALDLVYNVGPNAADDIYQGAFVTTNYDVLENDIDPENDELTLIELSNVSGGTATITEDNRVEATFDEGSAQITFTYTMIDIWGRSSSADVTIDNFTSTDDLSGIVALNAFPNPVQNVLNVDLQAFDNEVITVTLCSLDGRIIATQTTQNASNLSFNTSNAAAGIYILEAVGETKRGMRKVIKL
ncbi:MAG: hypothetical protein ACI85O_000392 [Saprospiraceae bacterium]|jgi:hypothetical protein